MDTILDTGYIPLTNEEIALFERKQQFMYAVFTKTLLTDQGKSFVQEESNTYNAQQVFGKLVTYYSKSTKSSMDASTILAYLTTATYGDGEWRGPSNGFILNWLDKMRNYESLIPTSDHFWDGAKRIMLENTTRDTVELQQVKN